MSALERSAEQNGHSYSLYPRTLVVSQPPLIGEQNTGLTLASLFAGWPREQLRQVYADESRADGPDGNGGWHLNLRSVSGYGLFRPMVQAYRARKGVTGRTELPPGIVSGKTGRWSSQPAVAVARAWADLLPYKVSPPLVRWLMDFAPDVVFSPLASIRWIDLVDDIAARVHAQVVPFFCDDWPTVCYGFSGLVRFPRSVLARHLRAVLRKAPVLVCIGDQMAREFQGRYGIHAEGFMRCVSTTQERPAPRGGTGPLRLLYAGGLHLKRWEVLDRLGHALARLGTEGVAVSLSIYAPASDVSEYRERLGRPGLVEVVGTLAVSDVSAKLAEADLLVHVESFDEEIARFTRLSLSTKLPEYLASGRPLLGIGPPGLASLEYIQECGAGLVVTEPDADAMVPVLRRLAAEPDLRAALGEAGWKAARSRHDGEQERERFRALLSSVARGRSGAAS